MIVEWKMSGSGGPSINCPEDLGEPTKDSITRGTMLRREPTRIELSDADRDELFDHRRSAAAAASSGTATPTFANSASSSTLATPSPQPQPDHTPPQPPPAPCKGQRLGLSTPKP